MKKLSGLITILILVLIVSSCKKKGDFYTDKDTYKQGEVITVVNTTEKPSNHYKWNFGGKEIVEENPIYELPKNTPIGSFTISVLPVNSLNTSDNWKKNSKTVTIVEAESAKFLFYLPSPITGAADEECEINRYDENENIVEVQVIGVSDTYPSCETSNNPTAATFDDLKSGEHKFLINGSSSSGSYSFSVILDLEGGFDCRIINVSTL